MRAGTKADLRLPCRFCGELVIVNQDGRLRYHRSSVPDAWHCRGSRRSFAEGAVIIRNLADGVVIKVRHPAGTLSDESVTDELVLLRPEWDELLRLVRDEL